MNKNYLEAVAFASISIAVIVFFTLTNFWIGTFAGSVGVGLSLMQAYQAGKEE